MQSLLAKLITVVFINEGLHVYNFVKRVMKFRNWFRPCGQDVSISRMSRLIDRNN